MNKSALRNFAVWARRDLIKRISDRANLLGVYENKPEKLVQATTATGFMINGITFEYKNEIRDNFIKRVKEHGFQDTIEEIAYTWFNRIVALRFMEVNGYLVNGKNNEKIYMIGSSISGKNEPDAVTNADKLSFVDKYKVYDLKDKNNINGLYRYVLTSQCNELNKVMPQMFEQISDYVELLLPDHLLDNGSIIDHLTHDIDANDFNITIKDKDGENASQVEIIGWLYQFYISEKKDQVFANKDKITKGNLPAVTQLFTPDWIVKYMVENSLGKMWIDGHSRTSIKSNLKYYVEEAEQTEEVKAKLKEINKEYANKNISEITFIDPCCGSGHILVYAFDLFYKMYLESGYVSSDIPSKILQNNLIGIDIDKRAVQLTSFALTMKALSYDKDFLSKDIHPTVIYVKESNSFNDVRLKEFIKLAKLNNQDEDIVYEIVEKFKDAELYGSLIKDFNHTPEQYDILLKQLTNTIKVDYFYNIVDQLCVKEVLPMLSDLLKQAIIMSSKYDIMATNPPYLSTSTNDKLKEFAYSFYPDSKTDMFAMFMEVPFVKDNGFLSMINMHSWMFLSSYENLRKKLIQTKEIISMIHLGTRAFEEIGGDVVQTTSFILRDKVSNYVGCYYSLLGYNSHKGKESAFINHQCKVYRNSSNKFSLLPGSPITYWAQLGVYNAFKRGENITKFADSFQGIITGNNEKFLRYWQEINNLKIAFNYDEIKAVDLEKTYWIPYNKGGEYRKWYGNQELVVFWKNGSKDKTRGKEQFNKYYLKEYFSWSYIATTTLATRRFPKGFLWDVHGSGVFAKNNYLNYLQGVLGSKIGVYLLNVINPTISYQVENILQFPIIYNNKKDEIVSELIKLCIDFSKQDWDMEETSWDFKNNPLILQDSKLLNLYEKYKNEANNRFEQLKKNEEELNKIFIEIYGLQDELTPEVSENDVTIARIYDIKNEIPEVMKNNSYVQTKEDVVKDLISYIVGCAFGRYSPYKEGLQFAGGKFEYAKYIDDLRQNNNIIKDIKNVVTSVLPTEENCLLISDKEYFDNDLCNYVVDFVRKIFGDECYEENLNFIATALDDSHKYTSKETIRNYLFSDFFKDHCKKYQNRPIYWLLDSGKNGGFRALMYLHRYDESTIPTARLSYLHELQWKYDQDKDRLERFIKNTSISSEKVKAQRELDLLNKQIVESRNYDEILNHASNMRITLDLDDGVKVNYQKLQCLDGDKDKNILSTYLKFKEKE